ncbi:hypothetical protein [Azospirillum doebereinerae]
MLTLGLAIHELATNAAKHGALSTGTGQVTVRWALQDPAEPSQSLHLEWRESDGPAVAPPRRRGFGSRLIERGVIDELEGEVRLDFASTGLCCTIDIPLRDPVDPESGRTP